MARFARGGRVGGIWFSDPEVMLLPLLDINYMKVLLNCSPAVSAFWKYIPTNPAAGCFISNNSIS